jgi:hypothetical protein
MLKQAESIGVAMNRLRWKGISKEQRSQVAIDLNKARWGEKKSCPCGCGLTLERAMKRHPARVKAAT